jgi:hypothetical protein
VSRNAGQVTTTQSVVGLAIIIVSCGAIVGLCSWLLLPAEQLPALETLQQEELDVPGEATCEDRLRAISERSRRPDVLEVDSASLIECPDTFDGRTVQYRGEVVGALLPRGDRAWAQMNDDLYALSIGPLPEHRQSVGGNAGMAVNLPAGVAQTITSVGGAQRRGDTLTVQGTFRSTALDDGEAPSILAISASDVAAGGTVASPRSTRRMVVAALLAALTFAVLGLRWHAAREWRR